jgi:hypothetical protein
LDAREANRALIDAQRQLLRAAAAAHETTHGRGQAQVRELKMRPMRTLHRPTKNSEMQPLTIHCPVCKTHAVGNDVYRSHIVGRKHAQMVEKLKKTGRKCGAWYQLPDGVCQMT